MKCTHCQKDYSDETITVHFDGTYNYQEMIDFVNKSYPNFKGEVLEISQPEQTQYGYNCGTVLIKLKI